MQGWKSTVRSRFFTTKELVIYSFIFLGACLLLYPKDKLDRYILIPERKNLELSIIYTRNLLRIWDAPAFRVHLLENLIQVGMMRDAEEEAKKLIGTPYEDRAYFALYRIEKSRYFARESSSTDLMQEYLVSTMEASKDKGLILEVHKEAILMNLPSVAMTSAERLYRLEGDISWLRKAYSYAVGLGDVQRALPYAIELYKKDIKEREKYLREMSYMLARSGEGRLLLEKHREAMGKSLYIEVLTRMEPKMLTPTQAERLVEDYLKLFMASKGYEARKRLFKSIVQMYLWREDYTGAKAFMARHYGEFIKDKETALFILKSAIATGDNHFALEVALKVKEEFIK
ncbi:MAG: hypothetical protein NZ827_06060 [Aquificaceae bacterium]|nr:hypothetical protein [Aquificaceae bacterium]